MTTTDKLTQHHLKTEWIDDTEGRAIMLTQHEDSCCEADTIVIHPWQLRLVCEQFGVIASDQQAAKAIAILQRRLLVLRDRIDELADYLCKHSDHKHADLSYEMTYANATADIAAEFVAELGSENIGTEPPKQTPDRSTPQIGTGVQQMTIDA